MSLDRTDPTAPAATLSPDLVGTAFEPVEGTWTPRDCSVYALGIGAGQADPSRELEFTTDNTRGVPQVVYPTFAVVAGCPAGIVPLLKLMAPHADLRLMLHGEQAVHQTRPLPPEAQVVTTARISALWDKGNATIVETTAEIHEAGSDELLATSVQSMFFRGFGGWGGERGPSSAAQPPTRPADVVLHAGTRPDQALLYRLSGDVNPLHSDPAAARKAGFDRPILHGLCTYGVTGRVLLAELGAGDPARFRSLSGRFKSPTYPGDALTVRVWEEADRYDFTVTNERDEVVVDNGTLRLGPG